MTKTDSQPATRQAVWFFSGTVVVLAAVLIVVVLALLLVQHRPPVQVTLQLDDMTYTVTTTRTTVQEVLTDEAVIVDRNTRLDPAASAPVVAGMTITVEQARSIALTVDGLTSVFSTFLENPSEILQNASITLNPDDVVYVNGARVNVDLLAQFPLAAHTIEVRRAMDVTLVVDNQTRTLRTTSTTVGDVLIEADVVLYLGDEVAPAPDAELSEGLTISITRSKPITITADGSTLETRAQGETVADALIEAGVTLVGMDYTIPPENARLSPDMQIEVVRVTEEVIAEQIPVPFETLFQANAELELDLRQVAQAGVDGIDQRTIRVRYENGVEVRRIDEGVTRIQEPVNQIVNYGTKIVIRVAETPDGPIEYWRKLRLYATSYHPAALGGDNITATGKRLVKGIVGIDPRLIPYGTRLYVPGYGYGEAADTGAPRANRYWIDLGYEDHDWQHWSRNVDVYLVPPIPEKIIYLLP